MEYDSDLSKLIRVQYDKLHTHVTHIATCVVETHTMITEYNQMVTDIRNLHSYVSQFRHVDAIRSLDNRLTELHDKLNTLTELLNLDNKLCKSIASATVPATASTESATASATVPATASVTTDATDIPTLSDATSSENVFSGMTDLIKSAIDNIHNK